MNSSISLITATRNSIATVAECLDSVALQRGVDLQHIVIDGASGDGTEAILAKQASAFDVLVSEPDSGIYDALNKGIALARGDVIGFLHSDDLFAHEHVLLRVAEAFADPRVDAVYGDLEYVSRDNPQHVVRHWESAPFCPELLRQGWMPPHPTLYVRRSVYEQVGGFDLSYRIAADYDFMLRLFSRPGLQPRYIPEVLVRMRVGGVSNRSLSTIYRKSMEDLRALRKNQIGGISTLLRKNLSKVVQFWL
jgi:glycosyltransferase